MACKACEERGKTWQGSDPKCAFKENYFSADNWNCATASMIRRVTEIEDKFEINHVFTNDQNYCTILTDDIKGVGNAIALWVTWYKSRGRTEAMWLMYSDIPPRAPTEAECLAIYNHYSTYV